MMMKKEKKMQGSTILGMCFASRHKVCDIPCSTYYVIEDINDAVLYVNQRVGRLSMYG